MTTPKLGFLLRLYQWTYPTDLLHYQLGRKTTKYYHSPTENAPKESQSIQLTPKLYQKGMKELLDTKYSTVFRVKYFFQTHFQSSKEIKLIWSKITTFFEYIILESCIFLHIAFSLSLPWILVKRGSMVRCSFLLECHTTILSSHSSTDTHTTLSPKSGHLAHQAMLQQKVSLDKQFSKKCQKIILRIIPKRKNLPKHSSFSFQTHS